MLKKLFARILDNERLPDEDKKAYRMAKDVDEMLALIDDNLTRNRVRLKQIQLDVGRLEEREGSASRKLKSGKLTGAAKRLELQEVLRIRKKLESFRRQSDIINSNLRQNEDLRARIDEARARDLRGLTQDQIEAVVLNTADSAREFRQEAAVAGELLKSEEGVLSGAEEAELAALELELTGENNEFQAQDEEESASDTSPSDADLEAELGELERDNRKRERELELE
ncbi:MAG: hypothetical protein KDB07_13450 [Planctomycetes bacterium]|nr:hypothetical protein [Planctomycetota bacterium]